MLPVLLTIIHRERSLMTTVTVDVADKWKLLALSNWQQKKRFTNYEQD